LLDVNSGSSVNSRIIGSIKTEKGHGTHSAKY
jgi:hypothetical protein